MRKTGVFVAVIVALFAISILLESNIVFAQASGVEVAPVPPVPETPPAPEAPTTSVTVSLPEARVIYRARSDSLREEIAVTREKLLELKRTGKELETRQLQIELKRLYEELARRGIEFNGQTGFDELSVDLKIPDVSGIRIPKVILRRDDHGNVIVGTVETPRHRKRGDQIGVFNNVYVDEDEYVEESAVAIFGDVHVDGEVEKEAIAIFGNVYISGVVNGDAAAPFGDVYLQEGAIVEGDISAVEVSAAETSVINGTIEEVHLPRLSWMPGEHGARSIYLMVATAAATKATLSILLGFLLLGLMPRNIRHVEQRIRICPVRSFLWGILFQVMLIPAALLLIVTVIGIPVALLGLPLLVVVAMLLGFVAFARILGNSLVASPEPEGRKWLQYTIGALIIHVPFLLGLAIWTIPSGSGESAERFIANLFIWAGLSILYLISTMGFGAAITSRLGSRPYVKSKNGTASSRLPSANMPPPPASGPTPMPAPPSSGP